LSDVPLLQGVPEISFIPHTLRETHEKILALYLEKSGETSVSDASPVALRLKAMAELFYHLYAMNDRAAKMSLPKYSYGDWLDNLAARKNVFRRPASYAVTTLTYHASAVYAAPLVIEAGMKARGDDDHTAFAVTQAGILTPEQMRQGVMTLTVPARAEEIGQISNGLPAGAVNKFIDKPPWSDAVTNDTPTVGGADIEDDDSLTTRYLLEWVTHNTAGARQAYEYWAREYAAQTGFELPSVRAFSAPDAPETVRVLCGGEPSQEWLDGLREFLSADDRRPLTDLVVTEIPEKVSYSTNLRYWIRREDAAAEVRIVNAVAAAAENYKIWQAVIGRDIKPGKLVELVMAAGAARCDVESPAHAVLQNNQIADFDADASTTEYAGLEDD
jgi:phage-related baseplate assembly protein